MAEPMSEIVADRPWQPWERNYSGGRIGVRQDGEWTIIHIESGGAVTTTSVREHEAWDMALQLSPQLKERLATLSEEARAARNALYSLTWRECDTDTLRRIADEKDCGHSCEYAGGRCPEIDRDGCALADADSIRELAKGIDLGNTTIKADVLRAIDSCGGTFPPNDRNSGYADGYNDALAAAEREVERLFSRVQS